MKEKLITSLSLCMLLTSCSLWQGKTIKSKEVPIIPRFVLFGNPEKTCVRISPDGTKLAYLAPQNNVLTVWVKAIGQDNSKPVTNLNRNIQEFVWAKNNKHIFFAQDADGDENWHIYRTDINTRETVDMTPFQGVRAYIHTVDKNFPNDILVVMNKENQKLFDAYRLDLLSGKLDLEAKNPGNIDTWLADSKLCVRAAVTANTDGSSALLVRENKDSKWERVLTWGFEDSLVGSVPPEGSRPVSFSRDGKSLYLIDSTGANTQQLVKMDLMTGKKEVLAVDNQYDVDTVTLNQDTYEPELVSFQRARKEWLALSRDLEQDLKIILALNKGDLSYIDRSSDNMRWVVGFENDDGPMAYYLYDRRTKRADFLFHDRPVLTQYTLASMKPISFTSRDGLTIHGYLTCPPGKQAKNLPMVLDVHGGPWWRHIWGYGNTPHNVTAQFLANRGYACLHVNYRGSSGYGKKFLNAGDREIGGKMHDDLIDAVNWAITEKIADPTKIAIMGSSFGGYSALVGATFTPEDFCCAIDLWGPSNLITLLDSIVSFRPMGKAKWYRRIGNPETDVEFLKSRSPLFNVDQIKIPILIAQGGNDPRVKPIESERLVAVLKEKNIDHEYMFFPNEGHGVARPENIFRLSVAVEKFLAKHLDGRFEK